MAKDKATKPVTRIEVIPEPEIQYAASPALFEEIKQWLKDRGGVDKKSESDSATYYDTLNFRLLREGIEYRIKEKKNQYRHDMKTPYDTHVREVVPDKNNILHRNELKFKTPAQKPTLEAFKAFNAMVVLKPVCARVVDFFDKKLEEKFRSCFSKHKMDHETDCKRSRVEYSFQTGQMETPDGKRKSKELYILELELREGLEEGLLEEKAELERLFVPKGLKFLEDRKIMMGFELLVPDMSGKQRLAYEDAKARNRPAKVPEFRQNTAPALPAAA